MRTLQFVKSKLKEWNKVTFGELKERKKSILTAIANFDAFEQEGNLSSKLQSGGPFKKGNKDKSLGPDGFTIIVYQECWDVIKEDLMRVFSKFHRSKGFLDHALERKRFSSKWRTWMRGCLSSISFAVLVNGNTKEWVKASKGLRQGDPLSPFLFTIVANMLNRLMLRAEESGLLEGFRVVNLEKSTLYGINVDLDQLNKMALVLDSKVLDWLVPYLGLLLGANPKAGVF
ncbi:hypothetical protein CK203_063587 [Vitis vinifera]|uniref:Uncharacterized protein n=1 Tax=Vitis vinifera TaxID=29760 RepID=A0A438G7S9_VITVI|nr:hypothetical protein CK203_063587 [Vitis vinifera]